MLGRLLRNMVKLCKYLNDRNNDGDPDDPEPSFTGKFELYEGLGGSPGGADCKMVCALNGGLVHIYLRGATGEGDAAWTTPPTDDLVKRVAALLYCDAAGKADPVGGSLNFGLYAALGGKPPKKDELVPAVLMRRGGFGANYEWANGTNPDGSATSATIDALDAAREDEFLDLKKRIDDLMSARSGDIILLMDSLKGHYHSVAMDTGDKGQHGSPSLQESEVPLVVSYKMLSDNELNPSSELDPRNTFVRRAVEKVLPGSTKRQVRHTTELTIRLVEALRGVQW